MRARARSTHTVLHRELTLAHGRNLCVCAARRYYGKGDEPPANVLRRHGYWVSKIHHAGAENFVAVGPKAGAELLRAIKAMGARNIADVAAKRGVDAYARVHMHHGI